MTAEIDCLDDEIFVMEGYGPTRLPTEYVTQTLRGAGIDAFRKDIAGSGDDLEDALRGIKEHQQDIDSWSNVHQARSVDDLTFWDWISILFGMADTSPLERDSENIRLLEQLGIKITQLTYNTRNLRGNG